MKQYKRLHARLCLRTVNVRTYVCMYVCIMYVCLYVCMYVCMYVCVHVCKYVCMCVCVCVWMDRWMYVCVFVYVDMCIYICVCVCVCLYIYVYICLYIYMSHNGMASIKKNIYIGFTLSQATKALRETRGIALLYFRPLHSKGVRGQRHAPAAP